MRSRIETIRSGVAANALPYPLDRLSAGIVRYRGLLLRAVAILLGLVVWDVYASTQPSYFFPSLSAVVDAFLEQYHEQALVARFLGSMRTLALGYFLGVVVGVPIGLLMGFSRTSEVVLDPYVTALYVMPLAAIVPLLVFIGGATFETRVVIVFMFALFEILINTYKGAKATPDGLKDVARSFGAGRTYLIRRVVIPFDLPYIFTGLRLGIGRSIKGLILAEILISFANLGALIRISQHEFRIAGIFSVVFVLMILGLLSTKALQRAERSLLDWKDYGEADR